MLSLTNVDAAYGSFQALFGVSMRVEAGEAVAVIGANGAGKTTLLRVISGLLPASGGDMTMDGVSLRTIAPHRIVATGIAHVPESRRLFPQLREVAFEAAWHGRIAMTEGHVPRFHALAPRMIAVHGYNGRGIAPGTMFGRLLAEVVLGRPEAMPLPAEPVRPARLRAARAALYARGAQAAHLVDARG